MAAAGHQLPLPLREGVGGRGRGDRRSSPPPNPLPQGEGRSALVASLPLLLRSACAALHVDPALEQTLTAALADPAPHRLDDGNAILPGLRSRTRRRTRAARRQPPRARHPPARLRAALRRRQPEDPPPRPARLRHRGARRRGREAARLSGTDPPPGHGQRRPLHHARTLRSRSPHLRGRRTRRRARTRGVRRIWCRPRWRTPTHSPPAPMRWPCSTPSSPRQKLAESGTWCRPQVTDDDAFLVHAGRHPVVEAALAGHAQFVPNDCDLSPEQRVLLLTGPNMAGKSTFLRQNALIVVLAQAGLPVPAEAATIGVVDRLFSRVGAADDLARGRSTFMVEMTETAAILHQAGPRSLVVVDEIGRGTATLDGLAIAWAVLEALHSAIRCRTIFATHFHELAELADRLPRLKPHTMRVKEWKGTVVFLHEVAAGAAGRSWGVHVAELAGVPAPVVRRAASLLASLEKHGGPLGAAGAPLTALPLFAASPPEATPEPDPLAEAIAALEPDRMTPARRARRTVSSESDAGSSRHGRELGRCIRNADPSRPAEAARGVRLRSHRRARRAGRGRRAGVARRRARRVPPPSRAHPAARAARLRAGADHRPAGRPPARQADRRADHRALRARHDGHRPGRTGASVGRRHRRLRPRRARAVQRHRPAVPHRQRTVAADAPGGRVHALLPVGPRREGRPRHPLDRGLPGRGRQGHHDPHRAARLRATSPATRSCSATSTPASAPPARRPASPTTSPPSRPNAPCAIAATATARSSSSRT